MRGIILQALNEEGGEGCAPIRVGIPLQLIMKTIVRAWRPSAAHGDPWGSRDPPAVSEGPHAAAGCWQDLCPMERGANVGSDLAAGLMTPWGTHHGAGCS